MSFPRVWIRLLLDRPARIRDIAKSCPEFGDHQSAMFQVAPGVVARFLARPLDEATRIACGVTGDARAVLDLSGGELGYLRQGKCSPDPLENARARLAVESSDDDVPELARVRAVMRAALRAAPHAESIAIPEARASFSREEFLERSESNDNLRHIPGRTTLTALERDQAGRWLQTQGNILYGVPEVGFLTIDYSDPMDAMSVIRPLEADMKTWGYAPPEGEIVMGDWRVSRQGVGVWLEPCDAGTDVLVESRHANYQASFASIARNQFKAMPIVQAHTWNDGDAAPRHRVDVMVCDDGARLLTTNGVGFRARPGFAMDEHGCIEIYTVGPNEGPRIARVLTALAECTYSSPQPFRFFDRMPFPEPIGNIAGLILAPRFKLVAMQDHTVTWCLAVPITVEELDNIRRGIHSGEQLIDTIDTEDRWPAIAERWSPLAS